MACSETRAITSFMVELSRVRWGYKPIAGALADMMLIDVVYSPVKIQNDVEKSTICREWSSVFPGDTVGFQHLR